MTKIDKTHEFGGDWTSLKLAALEGYLNAFTSALLNQKWCKGLVYIDAFSGTGQCDITTSDGITKQIDGSAKIALDTMPAFDELHFIDTKKKHTNALKDLCSNYPDRKCTVYYEDSNLIIPQLLGKLTKNHRGVIFVDPYGMHFNWETLSKVAASGTFDVWYLFPLSGFFRNATKSEDDMEVAKDEAIKRLLGDPNWRDALYKPPVIQDMFDVDPRERGDWKELRDYVTNRLKKIFPMVLEPRIIYTTNKIPKFALYFAIGNPSPQAGAVAKKIADHILGIKG